MTLLHHVGVAPSDVPEAVLLVEASLDPGDVLGALDDVRALGDRREYRSWTGRRTARDGAGDALVATCGFGAPPLAIAVEELARAGARRLVLLAEYRPDGHARVLVPAGAVRAEGTTAQYAPEEFPAVPDFPLAAALRHALGSGPGRSGSGGFGPGPGGAPEVVRSADVPDAEPPAGGVAGAGPPVAGTDRASAALFVVGAARGVAVAAVLVPAGAGPDAVPAGPVLDALVTAQAWREERR